MFREVVFPATGVVGASVGSRRLGGLVERFREIVDARLAGRLETAFRGGVVEKR